MRALSLFERYVDFRPAARELPAAVRAYRAAGLPWTAREVVPEPPPKPEENAAPGLRKGGAAMVEGKWKAGYRPLQKAADAGRWDEVAKGIAPFESALAKLTAASEKPRADFARDWDLGPKLDFPEIAGMKAGVQALALRAELRAHRGEGAAAVADLAAALRLCPLIQSDPTMLALFVRISGEVFAFDSIRRVAVEDPALLPALIAEIQRPSAPFDFARALRGEAYTSVVVPRNLDLYSKGEDGEEVPPDPKTLRRDGLPPNPISRAFMTRGLQFWAKIAAAERRYPNDPVALDAEMSRLSDAEDAKPGVSRMMNAMLAPSYSTAATSVPRAEAQRGVTLAYLRALNARSRTGTLPKPLVSGSDPFGHPYRAKLTVNGFRIWSVGPDGKDDGGVARSEQRGPGAKTDDIVAIFPPPPSSRPR